MQVDAQEQITIPQDICNRLGFATGTEIELEVIGETIQLRKKTRLDRGKQSVEALRGKATLNYTTDKMMQLTQGDD